MIIPDRHGGLAAWRVLQAIVLGVVQGITEFLPISLRRPSRSRVPPVRAPRPSLAFEVFLHGATLLAMLVYFRSRHRRTSSPRRPCPGEPDRAGDRRLVALIVAGTVVSGVVALLDRTGRRAHGGGPECGRRLVPRHRRASLAFAEIRFDERVARRRRARASMPWPTPAHRRPRAGTAVAPRPLALGLDDRGRHARGSRRARQAARFSFLLGSRSSRSRRAKDALDLISGAGDPAARFGVAVGGGSSPRE